MGAAGLASSTTAGIFGASTAAGGAAGYFSGKKGNDNDDHNDNNDEDDTNDKNDINDIKKNGSSNIVNLPCGCTLCEIETKFLEVDGKIKSKMVTYIDQNNKRVYIDQDGIDGPHCLFCPTHDGSFVKV